MPFKDWKEYYLNDKFWSEVRTARSLIPIPRYVDKDTYIVKLKRHTVFVKFKKFYLSTPNSKSLTGEITLDILWMFDTICDPDQYWKPDLKLK